MGKRGLTKQREERVNLVGELREIGVPIGQIAELLEVNALSVCNDLRWLREHRAAPETASAGTAFGLAFRRYVELLRNTAAFSDVERKVCSALETYLKIDKLRSFYAGVSSAADYMCCPVCDDADKPYLKLCFAIFGRVIDMTPTFSEWLRNTEVSPKNAEELRREILRLCLGNADVRVYFAPVWPDGAPDFVDSVLQKHLIPREVQVLQALYGLRREEQAIQVVATEFAVTRERMRQLEAKAMKKLRKQEVASQLRRLVYGGTAELRKFLRDWKERSLADETASVEAVRSDAQMKADFFAGESFLLDREWRISLNSLMVKIEDLGLSVRTGNCLFNVGLRYLGDVIQRSESALLKTKYFGRKSLRELRAVLAEDHGVRMGMILPPWMTEAFEGAKRAREDLRHEQE